MPEQILPFVAVALGAGTLAMVVAAWALRKRPSHERLIALTLFGTVLLGFAMGWVALTLAGG